MTLSAADVFEGELYLTRLIEQLEEAFPPVNPNPGDDLSTIMFRSGQRSVIEYLQSLDED